MRFPCTAALAGGLAVYGLAFGQTPTARRSFAVATIKLSDPAFGGTVGGFPDGGFEARGFTLKDLAGLAYGVDNRQLTGGPKWADSERYDVVGRTGGSKAKEDQILLMLQSLLEVRFQLRIHHATKEMPVYVLTVAKGGIRMKARTEGDGGAAPDMMIRGPAIPGRNTTMQLLAGGLQKIILDRPVIDKTELAGKYDFDLKWRPDPTQFHGNGDKMASDPNDPDLFTALQEQLGLKLTAGKEPADVLVIDSVEKPSEN